MLGRTCRRAIPHRDVPEERAASTKSLAITCNVPARETRANAGMLATPIATIAVTVDAPNTEASRIASSNAGKA